MNNITYTIAEIEQMEGHCELVDGKLYVENDVSPKHNAITNELSYYLNNYIKEHNKEFKVFTNNVALYVNELSELNKNSLLLPDVMVVNNTDKIDVKGVHCPPKFVVEITSEKSKKNDYNIKRSIYLSIGVEEYWIVDLQRDLIFKHLFCNDYIPDIFSLTNEIKVDSFEGLNVSLNQFLP